MKTKLDYVDIAGIIEFIDEEAGNKGFTLTTLSDLYEYLQEHGDEEISIIRHFNE